jgi:hypothetical protein
MIVQTIHTSQNDRSLSLISASPRSKILKLPELQSATPKQTVPIEENPFKMPSDVQVFSMRENDRNAKREVGAIDEGKAENESIKHLSKEPSQGKEFQSFAC